MDLQMQEAPPRRVTPDHQLRNLPDLPARKEPHALWRAARAGDVDAVREAVSAGLSPLIITGATGTAMFFQRMVSGFI